ncbi:MAG: hypothetical protein KC620_16955, partial [Myxococcales bacterium]|nr:hypothetical protein [Myxococcales bacterium]
QSAALAALLPGVFLFMMREPGGSTPFADPPLFLAPGDVAPAALWLRWPLLAAPEGSPVAFTHPDWRIGDRLDPTLPAVRDHLTRALIAVADAGLAGAVLDGLDDADAARVLLEALAGPASLGLSGDARAGLGLIALGAPGGPSDVTDVVTRGGYAFTAHWPQTAAAGLLLDAPALASLTAGQVRLAATLQLFAGGPCLFADDPRDLTPEALAPWRAAGEAGPVGRVLRVETTEGGLPTLLVAERAVAWLAWQAAAPVDLDPAALAPHLGQTATVFPAPGPQDAGLWVAVDARARAE